MLFVCFCMYRGFSHVSTKLSIRPLRHPNFLTRLYLKYPSSPYRSIAGEVFFLGVFFVGFLIRTFLMRFSPARQTCPAHSKNFAFNQKWISLCMLFFMFMLTPKYLNSFTYSKEYWPTFRSCFIYCTSGHY